MSAQAVTDFLTKVTENEDLMKEVIQVLDAEDDREAVASLAAQKGFEFTPEELWAEVYRRQAEFSRRQDLGELTDEELEAIAGGEMLVATALTVGLVTALGSAVSIAAAPKVKW
ncbi:MAG: Nif11-like leader peptide family natural product precursor [Cyanobacteriota bacterium]